MAHSCHCVLRPDGSGPDLGDAGVQRFRVFNWSFTGSQSVADSLRPHGADRFFESSRGFHHPAHWPIAMVAAGLVVFFGLHRRWVAGLRRFAGAGFRSFFFGKRGRVFLLLAVVWTAIIWAPVALSLESWLQNFPSEKYAVGLVLALLFLYLLGLAVLFIWSVVSRWIKIKTGVSLPASLQTGWQSFWKNKSNLLMVLVGFVALQIFLVGVYWLLESVSGMTSPLLVLIFFVVQQAFVFFRIQIRQMMYASFSALTVT